MLALRSIFVAVVRAQQSVGNPGPRVVAYIALMGICFPPMLAAWRKYLPGSQQQLALPAALVIAFSIAFATASAAKLSSGPIQLNYSMRLRIAAAVFLPAVALLFIARVSPEIALAAFAVFCLIPLQRLLRLPA